MSQYNRWRSWPLLLLLPLLGFSVGDQVIVTDEGAAKLCKTSRWKRSGVVTATAVPGCPTCVKIRRGLVLTESIYGGFLRLVSPPPPPPPSSPPPQPSPGPVQGVALPLSPAVTVPFVVSQGIPFARHELLTPDALRVESAGVEVPSQVRLLAQWPGGSVKAALVQWKAEPGAQYWLKFGPGVTRGTWPAVAAPVTPGVASLIPMTGAAISPTSVVAVVTEQGPIQTCTRAVDPFGPQLNLITRLCARADGFVELTPTVVGRLPETTSQTWPATPTIQARGYDWRFPVALSGDYRLGLETGSTTGAITAAPATLLQTGEVRFREGWFDRVALAYTAPGGATAGKKAPGWVETPGLSIAVRHFWQQFPTALRVDTGGLTVSLHPVEATDLVPEPGNSHPRPRTFYFKRAGGAKTYQVLLRPGGGAIAAAAALFSEPPRVVLPVAYLDHTRVFGRLVPSSVTPGYDRSLLEGFYARSYAEDGSCMNPLGWRDFGDRLRCGNEGPVVYNDTHVGATQWFRQYLRSGDGRWYQLADRATRHFMDLDVSHVERGNGLGSGEPLVIKHDNFDHEERNLHDGHAHLSGLVDYYLLTGDPRAEEVLREEADWFVARVTKGHWSVPAGGWTATKPHIAEAERDYAWPLFCLNEAYRGTGDVKYHQAAAGIVRHLLAWWQTDTDHLFNGAVLGRNDADAGTGWWAMAPKCDNCPAGSNGTNPWMAGALENALIAFVEADQDHHLVEAALVRTMILQTLAYVTRHGWTGSYFRYAEGSTLNGGDTHLLTPLAWAVREVARGVEHPEWYADVLPIWQTVTRKRWTDMTTNTPPSSTTATGPYGYEEVLGDFFALMQEPAP